MYPGPNEVTQEYRDIWKAMIPFPSYQVFQRGAYFSVELIPGHLGQGMRNSVFENRARADVDPCSLAAISLNTLYWYDSNKGRP